MLADISNPGRVSAMLPETFFVPTKPSTEESYSNSSYVPFAFCFTPVYSVR